MLPTKSEYFANEKRKKRERENSAVKVQYAKVVSLKGGEAVIRFIGESVSSEKTYKRLKSYVPTVGDRVMLINDIIIGGWIAQ